MAAAANAIAAIIEPPSDNADLCSNLVFLLLIICYEKLRCYPLKVVTRAQRLKNLTRYHTALCKARNASRDMGEDATDEFLEYLHLEIREIERAMEQLGRGDVATPNNSKRDMHAEVSVQFARALMEGMDPEGERVPAPEYLWQCKPVKTQHGKWHQISNLIYKAITGKNKDMWKYCREWHPKLPTFREWAVARTEAEDLDERRSIIERQIRGI